MLRPVLQTWSGRVRPPPGSTWGRQGASPLLLGALLAIGPVTATPQALWGQSGPQKRALIVTIGKYPEPSLYGYGQINAGNDGPLLVGALRSQGFDSTQTLLLVDAQATRQGILDAFRRHLLDPAQPGDIVVIHYSGHGHQITDDNGDELDGYDEVLVPYGAPNPEGREGFGSYAGERHIRDDELNVLLTELRQRIGPSGHVLVTIDACYSGSATRGPHELPVRGMAIPIGPAATARGNSGDFFESGPGTTRGGGPDLAPLVVISATDHDELDHEVWGPDRTPVGPLSLALNRTLPGLRVGMSYGAWFEQIRLVMATLVPTQSPQIEGATDAEVLSGRVTDHRRFFPVRDVLGDTVAVIGGGTLAGIQPGARVAFYALDASPDAPSLTTGIVAAVDALTADVFLPVPETADRVRASRAFLSELAFGDLAVRVATDGLLDPTQRARVVDALEPVPNLRLVDERPDVVLTAPGSPGAGVTLRTAADDAALAGPFDLTVEAGRSALAAELQSYARTRFLTQVELRDPRIDVRLEIVPATHDITRRGCVASDTTRYGASKSAGGWIFHKDDGYLLRLRNVGAAAAYVAVLELGPGGVAQLFPNAALRVSDNLLEPGATFLVQDLCFQADEPYGNYILKLFATTDRVDFGPIVEARGLPRGGARLGYLEQLVADAFRGTRSGVTGRAAGTGSTEAITIRVAPR